MHKKHEYSIHKRLFISKYATRAEIKCQTYPKNFNRVFSGFIRLTSRFYVRQLFLQPPFNLFDETETSIILSSHSGAPVSVIH